MASGSRKTPYRQYDRPGTPMRKTDYLYFLVAISVLGLVLGAVFGMWA